MYMCICIHMYVYIYICIRILHIHIHIHIHIYIYIYTYTYIYIYTCLYLYTYTHVYIYIYTGVCGLIATPQEIEQFKQLDIGTTSSNPGNKFLSTHVTRLGAAPPVAAARGDRGGRNITVKPFELVI